MMMVMMMMVSIHLSGRKSKLCIDLCPWSPALCCSCGVDLRSPILKFCPVLPRFCFLCVLNHPFLLLGKGEPTPPAGKFSNGEPHPQTPRSQEILISTTCPFIFRLAVRKCNPDSSSCAVENALNRQCRTASLKSLIPARL